VFGPVYGGWVANVLIKCIFYFYQRLGLADQISKTCNGGASYHAGNLQGQNLSILNKTTLFE